LFIDGQSHIVIDKISTASLIEEISPVKKELLPGVNLACSRRSDSGARAKNKASERAGKKRGETGREDEGTPVKLILKSPCRPL